MASVTFINQTQYEFALECLKTLSMQGFQITKEPERLAVATDNIVINRLLERLKESSTTVLPYFGKKRDKWLLVGQNRHTLDKALTRITSFIIPSYAEFDSNSGFAELRSFQPQKNKAHRLGMQLYELGYYSLMSPVEYRNIILNQMGLWLRLETVEPTLELPPQYTYRDLYQKFSQYLAKENWSQAENVLSEMNRLNLTTAENLQFLQIQWLAQQRKWQEIWDHPKFEILARLRVPRNVRVAMLTAFHYSILMPSERDEVWEDALNRFREKHKRLGTLLVGRFGITESPVVRVFAYQALLNKDTTSFERLLAEAPDSETTHCLNGLKTLLMPTDNAKPPVPDPLKQVLLALRENDYDKVITLVKSVEDTVARVLLAIEVAYHSRDDLIVKEAWTIYQSLTPEQKQMMATDHRYVGHYLDFLQEANTDQPKSIWGLDVAKARDIAWKGICDVEYHLRRLIENSYANKFGEDWESRINPTLREKWASTRSKDEKTFVQYGLPEPPLLDYTYLGDLVGLINKQWSLFENVFGSGKSAKREFTRVSEAIIRIRNPLAHNRDIPINELRRAEVYCTDLLLQLEAI